MGALAWLSAGCALGPAWRPAQLLGTEEPALVLVETPAGALPAPEGLRAASGQYRVIPLKWDPILAGDVGGYVVECAESGEGPFDRLVVLEGRGTLAHLDAGDDTPLQDGVTRYYRVRAFDSQGHLAPLASTLAVATTASLPEPPEGLRAYSRQPREVPLTWQTPDDPFVAGYVVERSPAPEGPFQVVAELEGRHATATIDTGLGDLRVFHYRVAARNPGGIAGPPSRPVRAVTKPVPLPPIGLRLAERRLGANVIEWEPNVETDLREYRLFRVGSDGESVPVATVPLDRTRVEDLTVGSGERITYAIVAIDRGGLESAASLPIEAEGEGYALEASLRPGGVALRWNARPQEGFVAAIVVRSNWLERDLATRTADGQYVDASIQPGRRYRYVVTLERPDGALASPSQPLEIDVPEDWRPPAEALALD